MLLRRLERRLVSMASTAGAASMAGPASAAVSRVEWAASTALSRVEWACLRHLEHGMQQRVATGGAEATLGSGRLSTPAIIPGAGERAGGWRQLS